jgi:hypothetical protein
MQIICHKTKKRCKILCNAPQWMDGLRRVEPLLIETGLCLGLLCSAKVRSEKRNNTEKDRIKYKTTEKKNKKDINRRIID